ncbi:hypothetical protein GCM10023219_03360 [Stakelama sediminis]|uniref:PDZ domain-containing protein n=1 Tax=Stakelama sediminis TaxID=463200 RepID=A0A840YZF7_9SPHN|nr:aspartyl protease family protein [Stakelama sediminis]MBB5719033.1 hypothetical protein [Stakelama sediminis]
MARLFLLFGLLLAWTPLHAEPARLKLAGDAAEQWVPFTLTPGNQIRFHLKINGRDAVAILDTGVSVSVVSSSFARSAGMRISARADADAVGGTVAIGWASPRSIHVGALKRTGGRIAVAQLTAMATGSKAPVDALIGADLLSCCALDIEYDRHRFRLLPSGTMPFTGASAPLHQVAGSKLYLTRLTLHGQRIQPVLVDTGDGGAITISKAAWMRTGMNSKRITTSVSYGLGGPIEMQLTVVPELHVANLTAKHVELRIEGADSFSEKTGLAGRIGTAFLQGYRVLLDPRAGHMVFQPGALADQQPIRSTSGLLVGLDRDRLRVLHVMANSPAAHTGWQDGDTICRVDGQPVASGDSSDTRWSAGPPGEVVHLGMCDGSRRTLKLADFY